MFVEEFMIIWRLIGLTSPNPVCGVNTVCPGSHGASGLAC